MLTRKLNIILSNWKGQQYEIDKRIPASYLFVLIVKRLFMAIYGAISGISHKGWLFLSWKATIKCRSKLKVGKAVSINRGCYIDALSHNGIQFGNNVSVGLNTRIEGTGNLQHLGKGMQVGNNVGLGTNNFFGCAGGIIIEDETIIGDYVSFHSENHVFEDPYRPIRLQGVKHKGIHIGNNCWIGAKSTILDGAIIEEGCVIAAGAVVTAGHYKAFGIYGGIPARLIKWREKEEVHA